MNAIITTATDTRQEIAHESKEGKAFLRRVVRDCKQSKSRWWLTADTTDANRWKVIFHRTVKGAAGDPDVDVRVKTDITIGVQPNDFNKVYDEGSPYQAVIVPPIKGIDIDYSGVTHFCDCVLADCSFMIERNCGSQSSSKHGIVMLGIRAYNRKRGYQVTIGHDTWIVNGDQVCWGSIRVR